MKMKMKMRHLPSSVESIFGSSAGSRGVAMVDIANRYVLILGWMDIGGVQLIFHTGLDV
jgi:hypothetical protein